MVRVRVMGCCSYFISRDLIITIEEYCRLVVFLLLLSLFSSYHQNTPILVIYISVIVVAVHSVLESVVYT